MRRIQILPPDPQDRARSRLAALEEVIAAETRSTRRQLLREVADDLRARTFREPAPAPREEPVPRSGGEDLTPEEWEARQRWAI